MRQDVMLGVLRGTSKNEFGSQNMIRNQLDHLEIQGSWADAVELAYTHSDEVDGMCRCVFYGWYLVLESFCIEPAPTQEVIDAAQVHLANAYDSALASSNPAILREVGYGMNIAAYLFPGDASANERAYSGILERALDLDGSDPLSIEIYNGSLSTGSRFTNPLNAGEWADYLLTKFPSEGEYDRYYRSVLCKRVGQHRSQPHAFGNGNL